MKFLIIVLIALLSSFIERMINGDYWNAVIAYIGALAVVGAILMIHSERKIK